MMIHFSVPEQKIVIPDKEFSGRINCNKLNQQWYIEDRIAFVYAGKAWPSLGSFHVKSSMNIGSPLRFWIHVLPLISSFATHIVW